MAHFIFLYLFLSLEEKKAAGNYDSAEGDKISDELEAL